MTNQELIGKLSELPPNDEVQISLDDFSTTYTPYEVSTCNGVVEIAITGPEQVYNY